MEESTNRYPSRRTVVIGAAGLVAACAASAVARPFAARADVLRPPGALDEAEFCARCIKCSRCITVCPQGIVKPMKLEDGVLQVRTPELDFHRGACDFCNLCVDVCPTAAFSAVDPLDPAAGRIGVAQIQSDCCIAYVSPGRCGVCVDVCPYGALSFDGSRRPQVDAARCNGCGECVKACPSSIELSYSGNRRGVEVVTEAQYEKGGVLV